MRLQFRHLLWLLTGVVGAYALYGAWIVGLRVTYPYDHLIWSESPFLTNMLKLHNDVELYGPPADANSFVYSPGLEYLSYAVLRPLGLHLDLVACRVVNVMVGVLAAVLAGRFMLRVADEQGARATGTDRAALAVFMTACAALVLLKNFTFDVCHPDNLHALHVAGGLALAHWAMRKQSLRASVAVAALLGFGLLLKQTVALGGIGSAVALAIIGRRQWGRSTAGWVIFAATATTGLSAYWLLVHQPHGQFWLLDVLREHAVTITKLDQLFTNDLPLHRGVLYFGAAALCVRALAGDNEEARNSAVLWLATGATAAAPALLAYAKHLGLFNNLVVIDLWAALLVVPTLLSMARAYLDKPTGEAGAVAAGALALLSLGLYPTKRVPTEEHRRYGRELERALRNDLDAGRSVLVAHGTAAWIRAGMRDVPLDRSNSVLELQLAKLQHQAHTSKRFAAKHYDRVYVSWPPYDLETLKALEANYRRQETIKRVVPVDPSHAVGSAPQLTAQLTVYVKR